MLENVSIGVIGAGNMGSALVGGLVRGERIAAANVIAADVDDAKLMMLRDRWAVRTTWDNRVCARDADVVLLAVKPQLIAGVLEEIAGDVGPEKTVLSIAAGVRTAFIEERLGMLHVVRAMPNTPALIGAGISAICPGRYADRSDLDLASEIMDVVGTVVEVSESEMDAVTGLSGSGPAYVYMVIEALADGGVRMGLSREVALKLATHTVSGAAKMVAEAGEHPAVLKDRVASPGGTTIAGLHALEAGGVRAALMTAVEAATGRSEELGRS